MNLCDKCPWYRSCKQFRNLHTFLFEGVVVISVHNFGTCAWRTEVQWQNPIFPASKTPALGHTPSPSCTPDPPLAVNS